MTSKSLLPTLELTEEEEEDMESLERRLKLFKRNKELSVHISKMFYSIKDKSFFSDFVKSIEIMNR